MQEFNNRLEDLRQVLVLEDNITEHPKINAILRSLNTTVSVDWASNLHEARTKISRRKILGRNYDLVLADMYLGEEQEFGADFLLECNQQYPVENLILMSAQSQLKTSEDRSFSTAFPFIKKSSSVSKIKDQIQSTVLSQEEDALHSSPEVVEDFRSNPEIKKFEQSLLMTGVIILLTLFLIWAYELSRPKYSQSSKKIQNTPLFQALNHHKTQANAQKLLQGGLTPLLNSAHQPSTTGDIFPSSKSLNDPSETKNIERHYLGALAKSI